MPYNKNVRILYISLYQKGIIIGQFFIQSIIYILRIHDVL